MPDKPDTRILTPDEASKAKAREIVGNVNNYAEENGELSISAFGPLATRIADAIATARQEERKKAFEDAIKIIDSAGEEWGDQARARKSKTYSAYVIAALDLKGRLEASPSAEKGSE